jgi:hypothetical protein
VIPEDLDLIAIFGTFMVCVICTLLLWGYRATLGALLQALAYGLHKIGVWGLHPFNFLASGVSSVDQQINAALASAVEHSWHAFAKLLNFSALLLHKSLNALADLAESTLNVAKHTAEHVIPNLIAAALVPFWNFRYDITHQLAYLWRVATNLAHQIDHAAAQVLPRTEIIIKKVIEPAVKAAVVAIPTQIPIPIPRLGTIERTLHGIDETLKDTLKKVTPAALAALFVGSVLARIGMSWLRCRNVRSTGKALCGMNPSALDKLLAGLIAIFGTLSIEKFAGEIQDVAAGFADTVVAFWRADHPGAGGDRALGATVMGGTAVGLTPDRALGQPTSGG